MKRALTVKGGYSGFGVRRVKFSTSQTGRFFRQIVASVVLRKSHLSCLFRKLRLSIGHVLSEKEAAKNRFP